MKLQEICQPYSGSYRNNEEYSRYLKSEGYKIPEIKNKMGFVLVSYYPEESEKSFKTLGDAEYAAPKKRNNHWQIFDGKSGDIVKEPEWIESDQYIFQKLHGDR